MSIFEILPALDISEVSTFMSCLNSYLYPLISFIEKRTYINEGMSKNMKLIASIIA